MNLLVLCHGRTAIIHGLSSAFAQASAEGRTSTARYSQGDQTLGDKSVTAILGPPSARTCIVRILEATTALLTRILAALALCLVVALMGLTVANIVLRRAGQPIEGVIELVSYGMLALIVTALPYAAQHEAHISVNILTDRLACQTRMRVHKVGYVISAFATLAVACAYLIGSLQVASSSVATGLRGIPILPFNILVVAGFVTWALQCTVSYVRSTNGNVEAGTDK